KQTSHYFESISSDDDGDEFEVQILADSDSDSERQEPLENRLDEQFINLEDEIEFHCNLDPAQTDDELDCTTDETQGENEQLSEMLRNKKKFPAFDIQEHGGNFGLSDFAKYLEEMHLADKTFGRVKKFPFQNSKKIR